MGETPHEILGIGELEIIRTVEQSHLPVRRTLERIGLPRATFYRWYDRYAAGGPEALADRQGTVGNFVPEAIRWNRKDHRYGNREGRSGPAAVGTRSG
jgi:hypothetical protein